MESLESFVNLETALRFCVLWIASVASLPRKDEVREASLRDYVADSRAFLNHFIDSLFFYGLLRRQVASQ